jgi:glucosamine-phosphate N-acetyltransferase
VGCGTLLLERKFIRGAGVAGHVEDVVVDEGSRGRGLGKLLLDALVALARELGCYKARRRSAVRWRKWPSCWLQAACVLTRRTTSVSRSACRVCAAQVILDCTEANSVFYGKCGFTRKEVQMALYL